MLPVLKAANDGEARISEVINTVGDVFGLSLHERAELLPSGRQTVLANRVHWAKTYLKQAGLLSPTRRGHFLITDRGITALRQEQQKIDNTFLEQFPEFLDFKSRTRAEKLEELVPATFEAAEALLETPDESLRRAHREIESQLAQELLDRVINSSPAFFERLVISLLLSMGYGGSAKEAGRALGKSHDGGVDGVIDQDVLGLDRVYVQAKRYSPGNNVGAAAIRDFFGSLDRFKAAKGLFVTTSAFTQDADETARFLSKRIVLIDGGRLALLMTRYNVGSRVEETLELKKIDEDFFVD